MKKKLSLLIAMTIAATTIFTGCGTKASADKSANGGTFKIGLEAAYAPFNWTQKDDSNGAVKIDGSSEYAGGYDIEIAKKIAKDLGKQLVVVKTEWDGLVPALTSGKIDAIIAGMSPTAERMKTIDFTNNYYKSNLVMVVKKGGKFDDATSIQDFKGAKITAQLNTFHYTVIDQINGVQKQPAMDNFPAMRVALESGIIDGYVSERPEGVSAQTANSKYKMVEFKTGFKTSDEDTSVAVGIVKNSDLKDKINKTLAGISEDERKTIMDTAIKNQPAAK
ncbi:transporter substrate-binding domain-containing protein [Clostridium manihotivorum]|uniref:ABC transporter substrate-binding protein n=1 Tax=Clostridium manihotivorum TaxID=2320868 RepID=A0A3R5THX3_9CLOT|nr:transporter substrate-binding domain-containing protein [Clostridium manihotivorum]QAA33843.1 ABC transporter substrate-binding protein [Clostridium manihotivorum]